MTRLTGLIAAPHTPLGNDGSLRLDMIDKQAAWLVRSGVAGAFICGTTGEGVCLTTEERRQVATRWFATAGDRLKVVVHVGHESSREAAELAAHAASGGAFAVAAMAPPFFKPASIAMLIDYLEPIAAAASQLPFYYYHIPSMTGVCLPMPRLLKEGSERILNLSGIKFTHSDLYEFQQCLKLDGGRFDIPFGQDENLLAALALGATGAVGSTYNYAAPLYLRMMRAFREGKLGEAQAISRQVVSMVELIIEYGVLPAGKAAMSMLGIECGPTRARVPELSGSRREEFLRRLKALEVIDPLL